MTAWEIDTAAKRARLVPRRNPYWRGIAGGRGGLSLGYRRVTNGVGAWIAKMVVNGQRVEGRIGFADDSTANSSAIGYRAAVAQALEWSVRQHAALVTTGDGLQKPSQRPTVGAAVEAYGKVRKARSERHGRNAEGRLSSIRPLRCDFRRHATIQAAVRHYRGLASPLAATSRGSNPDAWKERRR
jgi:hypothetical protein